MLDYNIIKLFIVFSIHDPSVFLSEDSAEILKLQNEAIGIPTHILTKSVSSDICDLFIVNYKNEINNYTNVEFIYDDKAESEKISKKMFDDFGGYIDVSIKQFRLKNKSLQVSIPKEKERVKKIKMTIL